MPHSPSIKNAIDRRLGKKGLGTNQNSGGTSMVKSAKDAPPGLRKSVNKRLHG